MDRIFISKRDRWFAGLAWLAVLCCAVVGVVLFTAMIVVSLTLFVVATLILSIYFRTFYRVTNREIFIHSGPFRWSIAPSDITEVSPTSSPLSGPACSLDRLRIVTVGRSIMISPSDKSEFLKTLMAVDEDLVIDGDGLRRKRE